MSVARTARRQAGRKIDEIAQVSSMLARPMGGWIATFQKAIGMSVPALAGRLGVSRNSVYCSIRNERAGTISLNQLDKVARAMGGRVVYAIVPLDGTVDEMVMGQARRNAARIVRQVRAHMALEGQTAGLRSEEEMIEELANDEAREMPRDFWR